LEHNEGDTEDDKIDYRDRIIIGDKQQNDIYRNKIEAPIRKGVRQG
jgi:hypothetical protein